MKPITYVAIGGLDLPCGFGFKNLLDSTMVVIHLCVGDIIVKIDPTVFEPLAIDQ